MKGLYVLIFAVVTFILLFFCKPEIYNINDTILYNNIVDALKSTFAITGLFISFFLFSFTRFDAKIKEINLITMSDILKKTNSNVIIDKVKLEQGEVYKDSFMSNKLNNTRHNVSGFQNKKIAFLNYESYEDLTLDQELSQLYIAKELRENRISNLIQGVYLKPAQSLTEDYFVLSVNKGMMVLDKINITNENVLIPFNDVYINDFRIYIKSIENMALKWIGKHTTNKFFN